MLQRVLSIVVVMIACCGSSPAQEIPKDATTLAALCESAADDSCDVQTRVHSKSFHRIARAMHPAAWFSAGVRPLLRSVEGGRLSGAITGKDIEPKTRGVLFGLNRMENGSGLGPEVTPF